MKKYLLFSVLLTGAILTSSMSKAQDWVAKMQDPNVNFFDVQKEFNKYYNKKERVMERLKKRASKKEGEAMSEDDEMEVPGYFQYKRWEWYMAPRVLPTGERINPAQVRKEYDQYRQQFSTMAAGNWSLIGPTNTSALSGAGRLNFVRVHPTDPNTLFVGSPSGGLWKSTDAGVTWSTNTDLIGQVIGSSDLAIDPINTNTMYLATGDETGAIGEPYSIGLLKTVDGGNTWNSTELTYFLANYRQISRVLINPSNTDIIIAATSGGIYRSTDAGATFTQVQANSFKDMEFKPGDPNTVYACGSQFYKSTDGGQTWTNITSGLPAAANVSRMAIAVTPADPTLVYMIVGLPAPNYGTEGFYKSNNSGTSFTNPSTPGLGTQQWYDLAIAASPADANEILLGGQTDFLRSTNGGTSWNQNGGFTHVDYHDIIYTSGTSYYVTSDGGIYHTTNSGGSYTELNNNLTIAEMYGFGQSSSNANLLIQGWQDNGTNRFNGTNWNAISGGDGMLCFIDWNNDQNMWAEHYNGSFERSTNGGASFSSAVGNINEAGAWVTPWLQDPVSAGTIYGGLINVWKSTNGGVSWTKLSNFTNTGTLNTLAVSPANNQVIWAAKAGGFYLSINGGGAWTTITNVPTGTITGIACSNTDANKAWITYSGFTNANKVFQTNDQGASWINISSSLPNLPVTCIEYVNNSNDGLYIGTDVGVFYKDASTNVWQPFSSGLPNIIVTQLEIYYPTNKIRATTYGRGMWESDLYVAGSYPPAAAFGSNKNIACPGAAIQFSDYSAGQPTSWHWTFSGGSPSTSTAQNPLVFYNTAGTFPVSLTVTNSNGADSITHSGFIIISASPYNPPSTVGANFCAPGIVNLSATGTGLGNLRWWDAPGGGNIVALGSAYSPNLTTTTTFYVDEDFPNGGQDFTGASDNGIGTGAFFTANDIRGLYFDVLQPVVLNSFDVYANSAGDRTIEILDAQGNTFVDTTVFIPASPTIPYTVNVNLTIYPGTNYFIKCRGFVDLFRNTAGAQYPYSSTNVNITGSNAGLPGYYYFFYNWVYTTITCNTSRAAVTANDTCSTVGVNVLSDNVGILEIYPNPNNGTFSIKFNPKVQDNYSLKITNTLGQIIYSEKLITLINGELDRKIDIGKYGKGV